MDRKGKTYLVTGGASGLGEATARMLAAQGANVAILDRDEERGPAVCKELGPRSAFFKMDATKEESIKAAVQGAAAKFGGVHGVINCAGVGSATTTINKKGGVHDSGIFDFVVQVNLYGTFNASKYAAAEMAKNEPDENGLRGVIINTASVAAIDGQKGQAAYSASKGAVTGMTLPMARDLGTYGIRVLTILPGIMETPLMAAASDKVKTGLALSVVAPKRLGKPEEFAHMCTAIIDNGYLNGECIRLDGAIRMGYQSKI
ncbi:3-hydroxyacyl-CoA dehydrogenase type-2 [Hondaea fermentalgiana]|uniref:3-hydroxyacyl-CoA dehydrogenase type-2 n=1 Tax=Hondaea fermentalgiana TaxID=2315210 RepID=A0A2R5GTS7_9STRA|nr:3-hydroxyacyl-CoA dehydrogenase type-2 [Hondaea fermentalgiana]|eukprot:GBG34250.1 3-hydroxyacyl-CoA dehydrogenase type-2 [Hondaea fermentalgiana]